MAQEVTIGGKKFPKWGIYASAAGGVAVVGYMVYKRKKNANNAAASSSSAISGTDPVTGLPYAEDNTVDPLTGETYLNEAQQYGSVSAAESSVQAGNSVSPYSYGSVYGSSSGVSNIPYSSFTGYQTGSNYTSNAQWAQAVTAGLTDIGYSSTDIAAALGNYLAGLPLTSGQQQIVAAADAEYGYPPAGVPPITTAPQTPPATTGNNSGGTTTTTTVTKVPVPHVVGLMADQAQPILKSADLKSTLSGPTFKSGGTAVRVITAQSPSAGTKVDPGTNVVLTYKIQQNALNI